MCSNSSPIVFSLLIAVSFLACGDSSEANRSTARSTKDTAGGGSFNWKKVAPRLTEDSFTLRLAAKAVQGAPGPVPAHRIRYEEPKTTPKPTVVTILVADSLTSEEAAKLLVRQLQRHPVGDVLARIVLVPDVALSEPGTASPGVELVSYLYVGGVGEAFCIDNDAPEGAISDEGGLFAIPRCDQTFFGGNPW